MNAERLLAHFETISEAPDAVARLRRFILDLAVRGKLVEQDPEDEPAEELLGKILELKIRSSGKLPKSDPQIIDRLFTNEPFSIPDSWTWVVLGQITDAITSGSRDWARHYSDSGAIFVRMGNLAKGDYRLRLDSIQYVSPPAGGEGTRTRLEAWDVLVSITGDVGMLGLIPESFGEAYINQHTALARPCSLLKGRYLPEVLRSDFAQSQFQEPQRGIKNSFRLSDLSAIVVPFPPLAEQHRIVAKVDELMALCDQLEASRQQREQTRERMVAASLQRLNQPSENPATFRQHASNALQTLPSLTTTPAQIKQLRQTILNLAVRGKLVEQDPEDEPAEELLKRIAAEKVQTGARIKTTKSIQESEKYLDIPIAWTWARLFDLGHTQTGTSPSSANPDLFGDEVPFIKPGNLDGKEIFYDGPGLSLEGVKQSRIAPSNTVLMVCIGATLGKVNKTTRPVCFNQQINSLTPAIGAIVDYLALALKSSDFQRLAWSKAGIGTLPIISKGKWEVLPIPLPPLAEQHRIVAKVDELMALCDQLEQQLSQADQQRRRLLEAVLAEALDGRLAAEEESHAGVA